MSTIKKSWMPVDWCQVSHVHIKIVITKSMDGYAPTIY